MGSSGNFFVSLGKRIRDRRRELGFTQEDMISKGFSARHWQMIESGRPFTLTTLLRIADVLDVSPEELIAGLHKAPRSSSGPS